MKLNLLVLYGSVRSMRQGIKAAPPGSIIGIPAGSSGLGLEQRSEVQLVGHH